jgi:beta-galactosidase
LPQAGKITVTAKSAGLRPVTAELESKPVSVVDGLATVQPGDGLPSYLQRGPTPATPSFKVTRVAVPIASATAGASATNTAASYDDNELTSWANDNKLATGWIRYELARPATLSEVAMKLSGWRQRSYPLRITVDGQEVYRGRTPLSLGYVTLPLKPVSGKIVKVELVDAAQIGDGFNFTELQNQANASTGDERQGRGTLSIVEIELYENSRVVE